MLIGLLIFLALPGLSPEIAGLAGSYTQVFFAPPALLTFLVAGLLAPRSGYLIGFSYGIFAAILWTLAVLAVGTEVDPATNPTLVIDPPALLLNMLVIGILYGTLVASFGRFLVRLVLFAQGPQPVSPQI